MRLLLQGQDDTIVSLPDLYVAFLAGGNFAIAPYLAQGYNKIDAYIAAGGGSGGQGGSCYAYRQFSGTRTRGGGGGGGGGAGQLKKIIGRSLTALAGSNPVGVGVGGITTPGYTDRTYTSPSVGVAGGNSSFAGVTAVGGGAGAPGGNAIKTGTQATGGGGGGGGGGNATIAAALGASPANTTQAGGGGGIQGAGAGGKGAGSNVNATAGTNGTAPDSLTFGGGGGGGGGRSGYSSVYATISKAVNGGSGGRGFGGALGGIDGGRGFGGWLQSGSPSYWFMQGHGGAGGGGHNLTAISGVANLFGQSADPDQTNALAQGTPSAGGSGGGASYYFDATAAPGGGEEGWYEGQVGFPGSPGCVLIRIYKA